MGTVNRLIQSYNDRAMAARFVESRPYPFTLTVTDGAPRSKAQNRLMNMWYSEVSEQKGDTTPQEVRAYCKLTIGVPILRSQNEAFRERYDEILKPLSYEQKLAIMSEPLNLPVTSLMNTKQLTEYLEGIIKHFGEQGIALTMPDELRQTDTNSGSPPPEADDAPSTSSAEPEEPSTASGSPIIECAKEMLSLAVLSYESEKDRDEALSQCMEQWSDKMPYQCAEADFIAVAATAVAKKQRTIEKARDFLAEKLGCSVADIGGEA